MAAYEGEGEGDTHINDLPDEIVEVITSYLPLSDRKSLSLVSSHWNQQAFSYSSMNGITLRIKGSILENRDIQSLLTTVRPYRHLVYTSGNPITKLDFAMVMSVLEVVGSRIQTCALMNRCTLRQLNRIIEEMPRLQHLCLSIVLSRGQAINLPVMPQLKELRMNNNVLIESWLISTRAAPNVRNLFMNLTGRIHGRQQFLNFISLYEHQLECFELIAAEARLPYNLLNLRMLHTLKLWDIQCERNERQLCGFFENLPVLQVAMLYFNITAPVLEVLCTRCACLCKLGFKVGALNGSCIRFLGHLTRLKDLLLDGLLKHEIIVECPPLRNVESFYLSKNPIDAGVSMEQLSRLFPGLRILKIDLTNGMQLNNVFLYGVSNYFSQITCLFIDSRYSCNEGPVDFVEPRAFSYLKKLTNLQELTLSCMRMFAVYCRASGEHCLFMNFQQMCNGDWIEKSRMNLRRLTIKDCHWVEGNIFNYVVTLFPSLQYLEVNRCRLITPEDMNMFRVVMPSCVVHYIPWDRPRCYMLLTG